MALDASIYGRFQPKSAASYAAEFEQLAGMREQRQDNALARAFRQEQMGQARAQAERGNALRALQQGLPGRSEAERVQAMRDAGFADEAAQYEEGMLKRDLTRADIGVKQATAKKSDADAAKTELETMDAALAQFNSLLPRVADPQSAAQWVRAQYQDPRVGPKISALMPLKDALSRIPQDPQQLAQWRDEQAMGIAKYREMLAAQARDAETARRNQAAEALTRRGQDVGAATTRRGQDMTDERSRELAQQARDNRPVTVMDDIGNPLSLPAAQAAGMPLYNASAAGQRRRQAESAKARQQLQATVQELRSYYDQLREGGGIVSEDQGALGNTMARVSSTGVGQALGGTVGTKNQQVRDKIEQTRPLLLNLIKEATGMSAQQMNSNAEMQLYLRAATDPTLSYEANIQALSNLDKLFGGGLGISAPSAPGTPATKPSMPSPDAIAAELARRRGQ